MTLASCKGRSVRLRGIEEPFPDEFLPGYFAPPPALVVGNEWRLIQRLRDVAAGGNSWRL
jgi:hypothetical protein